MTISLDQEAAVEGRWTVAERLVTERLVLRSWRLDDTDAALGIYGDAEIARWLSPAMDRAADAPAMRLLLQQWVAEDSRMIPPAGRWAIESRDDGRLVGGAILLPLPPGDVDLEMGWQLHSSAWATGMRRRRVAPTHDGRSVRDRRGSRRGPPAQPSRRGDRSPDRHGMGRRNGEVLRPATSGVPPAASGRGVGLPRAERTRSHRLAECVRPLVSPSERPAVRPGSRASGGAVASPTRLNRRAASTRSLVAGSQRIRPSEALPTGHKSALNLVRAPMACVHEQQLIHRGSGSLVRTEN